MEKESFCSPEVASILNTSFIPIKVDRESRPDIDDIYMNFVTATSGSGGWPLNVFLTPDLQPVFGGTYFPGPSTTPQQIRRGSGEADKPITFLDILVKMRTVWSSERQRCLDSALDITNQLRAFASEGSQSQSSPSDLSDEEPVDLDLLEDALNHFTSRYDAKYGGFLPNAPNGPKFPNPPNLTFLLRIGASIARPSTHTRFGFPAPIPGILGKESCSTAAAIALHTLLSIGRSGMRDQLGYGFHRYSVTPDWNLPHFEKMLTDNALLLSCYCDAWALSKDPEILGTIYNLVDYFTSSASPVVHQEGGWYASEDADSLPAAPAATPSHPNVMDKKEGAFYVWTLKEFESALGDRDASILARHFGVSADGNVPEQADIHDEFLTQNVLHIAATPSIISKEFGIPEDEIVAIVKAGRQKLIEHRDSQRQRPTVDTKIIAGWNGLAIASLARAANTLADIDRERSKRCFEAAEKALKFIMNELYDQDRGRLSRVYFPRPPGEPTTNGDHSPGDENAGFLNDYAYVTLACLALYDLTFHQPYLDWAVELSDYTIEHFKAESGGFYQAPITADGDDGHSERILNLKLGSDTSLPSPNGLVATNLWYLAGYLDTSSQRQPTPASDNTTSTRQPSSNSMTRPTSTSPPPAKLCPASRSKCCSTRSCMSVC